MSMGKDLGKSLSKKNVCDTWCSPSLHLCETLWPDVELGNSSLWEYVRPSLEATENYIICSALCQGVSAAPFFIVLSVAPMSFSWYLLHAGTVREANNQFLAALPSPSIGFAGFFVYPEVTSCTDCSVLPHWFVPSTAAFCTFHLLSRLSLNICQFNYKPFQGISCSVLYDSSAILHSWC